MKNMMKQKLSDLFKYVYKIKNEEFLKTRNVYIYLGKSLKT